MKVRDILTAPGKWCQGASAVDEEGTEVGPCNDDAVRHCLLGAIQKAYRDRDDRNGVMDVVTEYVGLKGYHTVIGFNDAGGRTFAEVRGLVEELDI